MEDPDGTKLGAPGPGGGPLVLPGPAPGPEEELFRDGVDALREQRFGTANRLLLRYLEQYPDGRYALAARELDTVSRHLALQLEAGGALGDVAGRTELVVTSTLFGLWGGIGLSLTFEFDLWVLLLPAATGGVGLGLSLAATDEGEVTRGQAALVTSGVTWGTWNGMGLSVLAGADTLEDWAGNTLLLGTVGFAGGLAGSRLLHPDAGDVSVVNSGGLWGGFGAGMLVLLAAPELDDDTALLLLVAGSDVGLATLAILTPELDMSSARVWLIDLGGALGVLAAASVLAVADGLGEPQLVGGGFLAGATAGLALTAYSTRNLDREESGGGKGVTFLPPSPFVLGPSSQPTRDRALGLHLLQGRF